MAIIGTGLLKIISFGQVAYFSFDLNYYDFSLNQTDLIILLLFLCFGSVGLLYCFFTNRFRKTLTSKLKKSKIVNMIWMLIVNSVWFALPIFAEIIICIFMETNFSVIKLFSADLPSLIYLTTIVMIFVIAFWSMLGDKIATNIFICFLLMLVTVISMTEYKYREASTKKEYEIIICEDNNSEQIYYAVISKGSNYSAYRCDIFPNENGNKLIIYTNIHRFFSLDSVSTISVCFERFDEEMEKYIPNVEFKTYADDKIV